MSNKQESSIAKFFDDESRSMRDRHLENGLPKSAIRQVDQIVQAECSSVLDVGSGPGSVLIELLDRGVDRATGIDLSEEMNTIATQRLAEKEYSDRVELIQGSFLSEELEPVDGISIHRVLCCHPDRPAMLEKSASLNPKTISITVPRDWKIMKFFVSIYGFIAKILDNFRPYIHNQQDIDNQLEELGYRVADREKGWWWVTTTYVLKSE